MMDKERKEPKTKKTKFVHICLAVIDGCKNPDSFGEICVWCNECGRFDVERGGINDTCN